MAAFYRDSLVPKLNEELSGKLGDGNWVAVDTDDLYDVYCLGNSEIKLSAFDRKELLEKEIHDLG